MKLKVTSVAIDKIKELMKEKDALDKKIRVYVQGYGWGGPSYGVALDEQNEEDIVEEIDGLTFLVDKNLANQAEVFHVDYTQNWTGKGFTIKTI